MIKLVDKKCETCGMVFENVFDDEKINCCGKPAKRMYGYRKYAEFIPAFYENIEHDPMWIDKREDFKRILKERKLVLRGAKAAYDI
jgi:hypothetical protein